MKSSEMHEGLPQKEVRDFLSIQMVKAYHEEGLNKKVTTNHRDFDDTFEWAKNDARQQIKYLKKHIENIGNKQAIIILIENNGWKEHDVSDENIHNDTEYRLAMNFIGTDEEHKQLIKNLYDNE